MPPRASGKDRVNKAPRPETRTTLYKEHPAQLQKAAFLGQAATNHMVLCPSPRVVCHHNRNCSGQAVGTEAVVAGLAVVAEGAVLASPR